MDAYDISENRSSTPWPEDVPERLVSYLDALVERKVEERLHFQRQGLPNRLLSADDLAHYLGISLRSVRTRIAAGELIPVRIGRLVKFTPETVAAYLRRQAGR